MFFIFPACSIADVVFVLDSSGSVGEENWKKVLEFVNSVVDRLDIGEYRTRVGAITYGNRATPNFHLNELYNKSEIFERVNNIQWKDQETNTSGAIWFMREIMFSTRNGDRRAAPNVGIVVTDGESNRDSHYTLPYAIEAKEAGITMFSIGIGDQVNATELQAISTNETMVFRADDFGALSNIEASLVSAACDIPVGKSIVPVLSQSPIFRKPSIAIIYRATAFTFS